jgi:hypothetical protein
MTDWTNPKSNITPHFTVGEALWLPKFQCYHIPSDEEKDNLLKLFEKLELVRTILNSPLVTHVAIRPILNNPNNKFHGQDYNALIGGSLKSGHKDGRAWDGHATLLTIDQAKALLIPELKTLGLRLEKDTTTWLHLDTLSPNPNRYFLSK